MLAEGGETSHNFFIDLKIPSVENTSGNSLRRTDVLKTVFLSITASKIKKEPK